MKPMRPLAGLALVASLLGPSAALAASYAFVSSSGANSNPCTRAEPCRSLQAGIDAASGGGQVQILDSGTYGFASITKSLTIIADGVTAHVRAVTIERGNARVVLRGLFIANQASEAIGINIIDAREVLIEDCTVEEFTANGIRSGGAETSLSIKDTISRMNGGSGVAIDAVITSHVVIDNSSFVDNGEDGIDAAAAQLTITNTLMAGNADSGLDQVGGLADVVQSIAADNGANGIRLASSARMMIQSTIMRGNALAGLRSTGSSIARISDTTITNNNVGVSNAATVETRENNMIDGNDDDIDGTPLTPIAEIEP